jgi:hypothetical protein
VPTKQRHNPRTDTVMPDALREVGFDEQGDVIYAYEVRGQKPTQQTTDRRR